MDAKRAHDTGPHEGAEEAEPEAELALPVELVANEAAGGEAANRAEDAGDRGLAGVEVVDGLVRYLPGRCSPGWRRPVDEPGLMPS